jgi:hypothetical protein
MELQGGQTEKRIASLGPEAGFDEADFRRFLAEFT